MVKGASEVLHAPAGAGKPVQVEERELWTAMEQLAPALPRPSDPLVWAERFFDVPPRSGSYRYEVRTRRLLPVEAGGPLVGATSLEEFARDYLAWCEEDREAGDCLGLLVGSAGELSSHGRYAVAMSIGWRAILEPMRESLRGMVTPRAVEAMIVSAMAMYLMLLILPEPISKVIAATITVFLIGYLGLDPLLKLKEAWIRLVDETDQAGDFQELREIGNRFGQATGPSVAKLVMLVVTAAVGTGGGLAARGTSLPGFFQASQQAELVGGLRLAMAGAVETVTVGQSIVTVSLAPGALAMSAGVSSGGGQVRQYNGDNFRRNLIKLTRQEPPDSHAHHVFPKMFHEILRKKGINVHDPRYGAWWGRQEHLQKSAQYNEDWRIFIDKHPEPTQEQIFDFARAMANKYGFQIYF
jgi:hypothetical protein